MPRVPYTSPVVGVDANPLPFSGGGEAPRLGPQGGAESMLMASDAIGTFTRGIEREQYRVERAQDRAEYKAERAQARAEALAERERIKQERLQDKVDDAAVAEGELALLKKLNELNDPQKGFFSLRGKAAFDGYAAYQANVQSAIAEQAKSLANDTQKALFTRRAMMREMTNLSQAGEHAAREAASWRATVQKSVADESGALFVMQPLDTSPAAGALAEDQSGPSPAAMTVAGQNFGDALQSAYEAKLNATGDVELATVEMRRMADSLVARAAETFTQKGDYDSALKVVEVYGGAGNAATMKAFAASLTEAKAKKVEHDGLTRSAFDLVDQAGAAAIEQNTADFRDGKLTMEQYEFKKGRINARLREVEDRAVRENNDALREGVANLKKAIERRAAEYAEADRTQGPVSSFDFDDVVGDKFKSRESQLNPEQVSAMRNAWASGMVESDTQWGLANATALMQDRSALQQTPWEDIQARFFGNLTAKTFNDVRSAWESARGVTTPGASRSGASRGNRTAAEADEEIGKLWWSADKNTFLLVKDMMAALDPVWSGLKDYSEITDRSKWKQQFDDAVAPVLRNKLTLSDPAKVSVNQVLADTLVELAAKAKTAPRQGGVVVWALPGSEPLTSLVMADGKRFDMASVGAEDLAVTAKRLAVSQDPADRALAASLSGLAPGELGQLSRGQVERFANAVTQGRLARDQAAARYVAVPINLSFRESIDQHFAAAIAHRRADPSRVSSYEEGVGLIFDKVAAEMAADPTLIEWAKYNLDDESIHPLVKTIAREAAVHAQISQTRQARVGVDARLLRDAAGQVLPQGERSPVPLPEHDLVKKTRASVRSTADLVGAGMSAWASSRAGADRKALVNMLAHKARDYYQQNPVVFDKM